MREILRRPNLLESLKATVLWAISVMIRLTLASKRLGVWGQTQGVGRRGCRRSSRSSDGNTPWRPPGPAVRRRRTKRNVGRFRPALQPRSGSFCPQYFEQCKSVGSQRDSRLAIFRQIPTRCRELLSRPVRRTAVLTCRQRLAFDFAWPWAFPRSTSQRNRQFQATQS